MTYIFLICCYINGYLLFLVCIIYVRHCFTFSKLLWSTFRIWYVVCKRNKFIWIMIPEAIINLSSDLSGLLQLKQTRNKMWLLTNLCGGHQLSREFGVSVGLQGQVSLTALWVLQLPVWFASWHWRWSWRCWYQKKEQLIAVLAAASSLLLGKQGCWWNYLDAEGPSCNHLAS